MQPVNHQRMFLGIMGLLLSFAWLVLWLWQHSAYGRYLDHGDWTRAGLVQSLCQSLPAGNWLVPLGLYAGGWLLMSAAMMLPTALPLVMRFQRLAIVRGERKMLTALLISGYLIVWFGFGVVAHLLDLVVHEVAGRSAWLTFNGWAIGAGVIALAGLFQFSALKEHCLTCCRAPLGFILRHWRGRQAKWQAIAIGIDHGLYCIGCCWALMLLMFVTGTASIGWMLLLGTVMAAEKNLPGGRLLAQPIGLVLLGCAGWMAAQNLI